MRTCIPKVKIIKISKLPYNPSLMVGPTTTIFFLFLILFWYDK